MKHKKHKLVIQTLGSVAATSFLITTALQEAEADTLTGVQPIQQQTQTKTSLLENVGQRLTGFQETAEGQIVYYDPQTGQMFYGWHQIAGKTYYFDPDTAFMATDQQYIEGHWYLFDKNTGEMQTGFQNLASYGQDKTVYYDKNGQMLYGQQKINGQWYLFDEVSGAMQTGFQNLNSYGQNKTVYYNKDGQMQYGWQDIQGQKYYFDKASGQMATGSVVIDGKSQAFNDQGQLQAETWGWPFPAVGKGYFSSGQLFGTHRGGEFRPNGFHNGLDFGSYDHPGTQVHAVHEGIVTQIGYLAGLEHYIVVSSAEYTFVYQEAFSSPSKISVSVGQKVETGTVLGIRDTEHLHLGITREKNITKALASSFIDDGTWIDPLTLIK
ncbi:MAG: peptidoglycan DD-metalloendopeptidase family protein [Lactobacillus sp.]|nr:peptidoglycan DD-metalloendopeptidase family protein [Lactobacillus sp.]